MPITAAPSDTRTYFIEQVDEAAIVQVYADGFPSLPLREKTLIWHLYLAAIAGRDIYYDQRYRYGIVMRETLEQILTHATGIPEATLAELQRYTKLFWINTGPYNNLTARKFVLNLSPDALLNAATIAASNGAVFPAATRSLADFLDTLAPSFFDPSVEPLVTNKAPTAGSDMLRDSASNLYVDVALDDLEGFTERYGLNSRLSKRNGALVEEVYRVGGMYGDQIARIVAHLRDAIPYATSEMAEALRALIRFYETGEDVDRERYDIAWVRDRQSPVDTINGFIEVYLDPRGIKGAWEALVYFVNHEKTKKIETLAANAQWFEDRMPWEPIYRKPSVLGVTAKAIDVVIETGDSGPVTPIGINLPNEQKIREEYGSKSVSLSNVTEAHEKSQPPAFREEFSWSAEEIDRAARWAAFAAELTTELHEVIGHGSGRMDPNISTPPQLLLKEHYSALEEARADLVALYFVADRRLVELGLIAGEDHDEIVRAEYEAYARNALVQLRRVRHGTHIEEDHMRNRHMVVSWLITHSRAIEVRRRDGKTYYAVTDVAAFREAVGRLLAEVQRIKAVGDYDAARALFETYGIHFDPALRDEIVTRVAALNLPSYTGFVMPRLKADHLADGSIADVTISYPLDLATQMLEYSAMTRR